MSVAGRAAMFFQIAEKFSARMNFSFGVDERELQRQKPAGGGPVTGAHSGTKRIVGGQHQLVQGYRPRLGLRLRQGKSRNQRTRSDDAKAGPADRRPQGAQRSE